jgi:hypothetical protein
MTANPYNTIHINDLTADHIQIVPNNDADGTCSLRVDRIEYYDEVLDQPVMDMRSRYYLEPNECMSRREYATKYPSPLEALAKREEFVALLKSNVSAVELLPAAVRLATEIPQAVELPAESDFNKAFEQITPPEGGSMKVVSIKNGKSAQKDLFYAIRFVNPKQLEEKEEKQVPWVRYYSGASLAEYVEAAESFEEMDQAVQMARILCEAYLDLELDFLQAPVEAQFKLTMLGFGHRANFDQIVLSFKEGMLLQIVKVTDTPAGWMEDPVWEDKYEWVWPADPEDEEVDEEEDA